MLDANSMFQSIQGAFASATVRETDGMGRRIIANLSKKRLAEKACAWLAGTRGCEFAALLLWMLVVRPDCFDPSPSRVRFRLTKANATRTVGASVL